jgi:hypothetical protein
MQRGCKAVKRYPNSTLDQPRQREPASHETTSDLAALFVNQHALTTPRVRNPGMCTPTARPFRASNSTRADIFYHSMNQEIDRESLEYLLGYPEMPPGFPAPVAIKQNPEASPTAPISIKPEPGLEDEDGQNIKTESAAIKAEDADTKAEECLIKQEIATIQHLAHTYRPYGSLPDAEGMTIQCQFCSFTWRDWRELWAHWAVHLGIHTTRCIVCKFRYSNDEAAKKHAAGRGHQEALRRNGIDG